MVRPVLNFDSSMTIAEAERALDMHGKEPEQKHRRERFLKNLEDIFVREKMINRYSIGKPQFEAILKLIYLFDYLPQNIRGALSGPSYSQLL